MCDWLMDFPVVQLSFHKCKSGCSGTDYIGSYESSAYSVIVSVIGLGFMIRIETDMKWKPAKL